MAVFAQRMLHVHVTGYGDVADAWVVSEIRSGRSRESAKTTRGIDAFHLMRDGGTWRIASLAVEPELPGRPLVVPPRRPARSATPGRAAPKSSP
jgi:hypothetical protein